MHGIETMAYAMDSGTPWHIFETASRSKALPKNAKSKDMIKAAGLAWEVALGDIKFKGKAIPGKQCIYRVTDERVLGIGSPGYNLFQNASAFEFCDSLVADRIMHYVTAGSLLGGSRIWILGQLDRDMLVCGERHGQYILVTTGHDVQTGITGMPTGVRVVCWNTLQAAMAGGGGVRISHHPQLEDRLEAARHVLDVTTESMRKMRTYLERASGIVVPQDALEAVEERLFGSLDDDTPTKRANAIELFREMYAQEAERNGETVYSLINAITGFSDHGKRQKGTDEQRAERRFLSITEGRAARFKAKGLHKMEEVFPELLTPIARVKVPAHRRHAVAA